MHDVCVGYETQLAFVDLENPGIFNTTTGSLDPLSGKNFKVIASSVTYVCYGPVGCDMFSSQSFCSKRDITTLMLVFSAVFAVLGDAFSEKKLMNVIIMFISGESTIEFRTLRLILDRVFISGLLSLVTYESRTIALNRRSFFFFGM